MSGLEIEEEHGKTTEPLENLSEGMGEAAAERIQPGANFSLP